MQIITQNNKIKVTINRASWADMNLLKQEALKCLDIKNISFDFTNQVEFIDMCASLLIKAETSQTFNEALFRCLKYCNYDDAIPITEQLLEDKPQLIEDYYEIASNCIEVNLRPFFKSLVTEFKRRFKLPTQDNQE